MKQKHEYKSPNKHDYGIFRWYHYLQLILLMILPQKLKKYHWIYVGIYLIFSWIIFIYFGIVKEIQNHRPFMTSLIFGFAFALKIVSRTVLFIFYVIFYINNKCMLPWININKYNDDIYGKKIKLTNLRFIFWVIIMVIIVILQVKRQTFDVVRRVDTGFEYILVYFDFYCIEIPSTIGIFTLSLIYLDLELWLKNMNKLLLPKEGNSVVIDNDTVKVNVKTQESLNFYDIMIEYKAKYDEFKEINHWFNWIVSMKICSNLFWFWYNINRFKSNDKIYASVLYCTWNSIIIIEFVYTGNKVNNMYDILKNNVNTYRLFTDINNVDYNDYLYFCNIITNYALNATFMESLVSIRNTVVFIAIFLFFKFVQYNLF